MCITDIFASGATSTTTINNSVIIKQYHYEIDERDFNEATIKFGVNACH